MILAQPTPDEVRRIAALKEYEVLDTLPEQALDDLTSLAAAICGTPIAMISLVDEHRQWFKSRVGTEMVETARDISFCGHAVHQRDLFVIPDATHDERFADNPLVTGAPRICFYAGAPLVNSEDAALGALCVIDHVPRVLTEEQQEALRILSRQVMAHLELHRQTRTLFESESKFRMLAENISDVFWIASPDLQKIYYVSPGYETIWGRSAESLYADPHQWLMAVVPEERAHVFGVFAGLMEDEPSVNVDYRIMRPDGTLRWVHSRGFQVRDAAGRLVRLTGIVADITESKRAEEVLRGSSARGAVRQRTNVVKELAIIVVASVLVFVSCYWLGLSDESFAYIAAHGEGAGTFLDEAIFTLVFFCLTLLVFSYRRWRESRAETLSQMQISNSLSVLHQEMEARVQQRTAELVKTNHALQTEATERQRAEAVIKRFPAIIESSDDAILSKTLEGIVTSWNPAAERMFGYTASEMIGQPITRLFPPDRLHEEGEILARIARGERVRHFETVRVRKDGRQIDVSATISPIIDADGIVTGVSKIIRDITERKLSEKALQEERDFVSAVVDTVGSLVVVLDRKAGIVRFNRACEQLTGHSFEEVKGRNLIDLLIMPEERATTTAEFQNLCAGQFPNTYENHWVTRQGNPRAIAWSNTALVDASGEVEYVIGTGTDITDRKRSEEALRESRATLDSALASMSDAVFITDSNGRFVEFNDAFVSLHRFKNRDECYKVFSEYADFLEVFLPNGELAPLDMWAVPRALRGETVANAEFTLRRKDTGETWVGTYSFSPILNNQGVIVGSVTVGRDITERKRDAEQIAEQAAFLDKARDAILVRDLEGKILFWNSGAERMYGWTRTEAVGRNIGGLLYTDPKKFEEANAETIRQGEWQGELQHLTKEKGEITIEARWTLIRDNEGKPKSVLAINTDITEKKKIEGQFLRAQRMESIGTLAGGVAHDLNNILSPIMMAIEILQELSTDPQAKNILETIEVSAKRGADIVRQVLSFARGLEGERIEVQPKHLLKDLENIIKDTFPKDIRLRFAVPNDIWTILGDPTQVHQILLNLCVNARDAMPNGGSLTVSVENCVLDEHYAAMNIQARAGRFVVISVSDTGTGIPQGILDKIFEPFFTTKELNKGTGLGLSTVMAIVKSHDGLINVYSEPGKGTTFMVYLPAMETTSEPQREQAEVASLPRGNGETILVVDDEASILTITSQTLQAFGYRVLTAVNGAAAVAAYAKHQDEIAVVLTDMMMPIMDGPATIHALMQINPTIKIVAASGLNTNGGEAKVASVGIKHFLTKPYTAGTLLKTVRTILDEA